MAKNYTGKQILMETFRAEGVRRVFGNPGTTELPLLDALLDNPDIEYVLALHEAVAVTMADAYAQATGEVGVVNLHVGPGLGNGLGSVYNAWEGQTPLLVTAGQQDNRMRLREPLLGHDLVAMAAPLTKWSVQADHIDELPHLLNRAFKVARDTPAGPVFVALPLNLMDQLTENPPMQPSCLFPLTAPDADGIKRAAGMLLEARKPLILCGDKVARCGAVEALVALSERLGASVYNVVLPARVNFPNQHPHFRDRVPNDQAGIRNCVGDSDVVLMVGGEFFEEVWFTGLSAFPEGVSLIQIDPSPANIGRNYPVDCGLLADPKSALEALNQAISAGAGPAFLGSGRRSERTAQRGRVGRTGNGLRRRGQ